MKSKKGLPWVTIPLDSFKRFDQEGVMIEVLVPRRWGLVPSDQVQWECGCTLSGLAEVVANRGSSSTKERLVIRKVI